MRKLILMVGLVVVACACDPARKPPDAETNSPQAPNSLEKPGWGKLPQFPVPDGRPGTWTECVGLRAEWRGVGSGVTRMRTDAHVRYRAYGHWTGPPSWPDTVHVQVKGDAADDLEYFDEDGNAVQLRHRRREVIMHGVSSLRCDRALPPRGWWMRCESLEVVTGDFEQERATVIRWPSSDREPSSIYPEVRFRTLGRGCIEWYVTDDNPWSNTTGIIANVARLRCE